MRARKLRDEPRHRSRRGRPGGVATCIASELFTTASRRVRTCGKKAGLSGILVPPPSPISAIQRCGSRSGTRSLSAREISDPTAAKARSRKTTPGEAASAGFAANCKQPRVQSTLPIADIFRQRLPRPGDGRGGFGFVSACSGSAAASDDAAVDLHRNRAGGGGGPGRQPHIAASSFSGRDISLATPRHRSGAGADIVERRHRRYCARSMDVHIPRARSASSI